MRNLFNISALLCAAALITACSNEEMMERRPYTDCNDGGKHTNVRRRQLPCELDNR